MKEGVREREREGGREGGREEGGCAQKVKKGWKGEREGGRHKLKVRKGGREGVGKRGRSVWCVLAVHALQTVVLRYM